MVKFSKKIKKSIKIRLCIFDFTDSFTFIHEAETNYFDISTVEKINLPLAADIVVVDSSSAVGLSSADLPSADLLSDD